MKTSKKKGPLTKEEQKEIEKFYNIKIIDSEKGIIEYKGKTWRPIKGFSEYLCICDDNEPILTIGEMRLVDINYDPNAVPESFLKELQKG